MQYRIDNRSGNKLSVLGYGGMRLPGTLNRIDKVKSEALIAKAYEAGINYYDTAYIYSGSEEALGEIFEKLGIRTKIYIATKLPHTLCRSKEDFDKYLKEQKRRLRTDYIDYYLIHNISDYEQWERLCNFGIKDWIAEKKKNGEIHQIGFSFHGAQKDFFRMLDAYDWDFVQIQYNYININYQAGAAGLRRAAQMGLPVFIMEPLLGGKLVNGLPKKAVNLMQEARPGSTPVSWGLGWLWNQPEVTVVLSGMSEAAQLEENLKLAEGADPDAFGEPEQQTIQKVIELFNEGDKVRCTGCNYCMPCPKGINIPASFAAYNTSYNIGWGTGVKHYMIAAGVMGERPHFAGDCVGCGKCEKHCPQGIEIRRKLVSVKRRFEFPGTSIAVKVLKKILR